tara:strand:+ start:7062 stop:9053 length:1992 start_codon:yes stop_codon:yes gene_type:complete
MKINKAELLTALKSDLKAADTLKRSQDSTIAKWKAEYNGEPYGNESAGKSAVVSRDIKKQSEWQHATIVDPFVSTSDVIKCVPITFEDEDSARQNEILLNSQFCRKFDRFNFISKAVKVLDREGTLIVQTGWDYEDKEVTSVVDTIVVDEFGQEDVVEQEVKETVVVKNQPTAKVCRNEDIYLDPTCQDSLDEAEFVIHRYETNLSALRKDGRYKNLDRVMKSGNEDYDYDSPDDTDFKFSDEPRKKLVVYEYWGNYDIDGDGIAEPIVCAWINDIIIRLGANPYPDSKPPFIVVPFNSVPFKIHGEANAELIGDNQKVKTAVIRGIIDNMAQSNNGQVATRKGALDPMNRKKFLSGKNFEFNGSLTDFWQGSYNSIPSSAFDMIGLMNNEIESITGTKSFSGGINAGSLGATATGARGAMDATSTRRMNIVRNVAENLIKPLMRKWMSYNSEFLEDEEIVRVTNEEFVPVRRDDLEGRIDVDITIATAEDNAAKSQELSFLLQTVGPNEDPEIRRELMANIMELMRMPDQAKRLRDYQPKPDPIQQKIQEMQLENAMLENEHLKAQIKDKHARAGENIVDAELKRNKAAVEAAKARKLTSEADMTDLRFVKEDEGFSHLEQVELADIKHQQLMEMAQKKHKDNIEQMYAQYLAGDKNIGVVS